MSGFAEQWANLPPFLAAHVRLTLLALTIGLLVSLPLGIAASRRSQLERVALGVASVAQTIPGLALMALMVPMLGALGPRFEALGWAAPPSIGFLPAVLALSLYSVLPMLRNTVTGLVGVDPALREAARGVGMSPFEVLWYVELPLALPTIVAGVRTATVWSVGTATLATPVGAASLGNPIFAGLQTRNLAAVVAGSLAAALLAIVLDGLVRSLELGLTKRSRAITWAAILGLALVAGAAIVGPTTNDSSSRTGGFEVVVGAKPFTEQYVLAELIGQVLAQDDATSVRLVPSLGSNLAFDALVSGNLDVYVDYTGTIWATILERSTLDTDRAAVLAAVRRQLPEAYGVHVVASLGFENTYALAMRAAKARELGIGRISDLRGHARDFAIASDYEFFDRAEWAVLEQHYRLHFADERSMDPSLMYEAIRAGSVEVIGAYSTDGRIEAYDLIVLEDDLAAIPPYDAIIVVSGRLVREAPRLVDRLRALDGRFDMETMQRLNREVDLGGRGPAEVARRWLATARAIGRD
jgi:osmoprotectant transport system permease protein